MINKFQISNFKFQIREKGQSLVELLLVIGISSIILPALLTGLVSSRGGKAQQFQRAAAIAILDEVVEGIRSVRENGWTGVSINGTFHTEVLGSSWSLVAGSQTDANGFTRQVVISDVYRDPPMVGPIVESAGTQDPSSKKIEVTISWGLPYISSITNTLYMTRYLDNDAYIDTSVADFSLGTLVSTAITNTNGGEVILGAGGQGNWCEPNLSIPNLDLPGSGVANAITAIEGKVFVGTGENASGLSFADVDIANTNPPTFALGGIFNGYKTNGVFGETNYGYIATDTNAKEVVIIDLNQIVNGEYAEIGYFDSPGSDDGNTVFVSGNIGYMVADDYLYSFDLSSKTGSRPILDVNGVDVGDEGYKVFVVGNYAYVAVDAPSYELQIVDVSNPSDLRIVGGVDIDPGGLASGENGYDVYVNPSGTRAYLVTSSFPSLNEFFIIDVTNKTSPTIVGSYDTSGMDPRGLTVVTGNKAIVVGLGGEEYQVIDISNESLPQGCGGLQMDSGISGIYSIVEQDGDAYSYILTRDGMAEFQAIEGGPGGQYAAAGTFTSRIFDPGFTTVFNRFDAAFLTLQETTIGFQVAVASAVNGNCTDATYTFIGPNLTSDPTDKFASGSAIPILSSGSYQNPGRCFRYKVYFTSNDTTQTPQLNDVTINYSP